MRTPGPTARAILQILDPAKGGVVAPTSGFIVLKLKEKGIQVEKTALYHILARLIDSGKVVRTETADGGALYSRTEILARFPQMVPSLRDAPALHVRRGRTTSERVVENRFKRRIRRWQDAAVQRGAHDHRDPSRPCPVRGCWAWPPKAALRKVESFERQRTKSLRKRR